MGRGQRLKPTHVKELALINNLNILEVDSLSDSGTINKLKNINADIFIVVAYKILPEEIYSIPKFGTFNLHTSLLPKYIGASPIQYALINGDPYTGLTTFFINDKIDQGEIIYQKKIELDKYINFDVLLNKMINESKEVLKNTLKFIINKQTNKFNNIPKSYAPKIKKEDFIINWNNSCRKIHNQIRALSYKGAYSWVENKRIKFYDTNYKQDNHTKAYGYFNLIGNQLKITTNDGYLYAENVQLEGKKKVSAVNFYNSRPNNSNIFGK